MQDKRAAPRRDIIYYLEVQDAATGDPVGRVVDISDGGLLLVCERPPDTGRRIEATVYLPEGIGDVSRFSCVLTTRWRRRDHNPDFTLVGCRMEVAPEYMDTVYQVIAQYSFNES